MLRFLMAAVVLIFTCGPLHAQPAGARGPAGAFATGKYRNMFAEIGRSDAEIRKKIDAAFQQLFHGDPDTQAVFYWSGENANGRLAYLSDINNRDVRSEGMSYGMMIAVQLDKKAEFDALWNWSRTFMYNDSPAHPAYGFFSWSMKTDGTPNSESPAPDGEEYWVMALYFASARWGDGKGIYDYRAMADRLLSDIKNRGVISGPWKSRPDRVETDGAQFNLEHKMVRFTPDNRRTDHTDPSYHLPAFYELWARWGPRADRAFWLEAARVSRDFLQKATHPATGLAPEYANFDGTPVTNSFNKFSATFGPDSWRTAANWSVDWAWWAADPRQRELSDRIQAFFESKGLRTHGNRWALDGSKELESNHSTALVATNAVASLAATHPRAARFVEELWNAEIPAGRYRYYDGMWYLMGLLHCSGQYRIWTPKWAGDAGPAGQLPPGQEERIGASFVLARGRKPTAAELEAWGRDGGRSIPDLLAQHRRDLEADAKASQVVAVKAWRDAFGAAPGEDAVKQQRGGDTYFALLQRHVASLAGRVTEYEQVLQRAYRLRLRREAHAVEIDYWKRQPALPFALLVACVDDWARRNRPGLMATTGVASVSVNSDYLETVRLSPAVAMEARAAVGLPAAAVSDHLGEAALPLAAGKTVIASGAAHLVSVGGVHFAAAGR